MNYRFRAWLRKNSTEAIKSKSSKSEYFTVKGLKVRFSDHLTSNLLECDIQIIQTEENGYICFVKDYAKPILFKNIRDLKCYVMSSVQLLDTFRQIFPKVEIKEVEVIKEVNSVNPITDINDLQRECLLQGFYACASAEVRKDILSFLFRLTKDQLISFNKFCTVDYRGFTPASKLKYLQWKANNNIVSK